MQMAFQCAHSIAGWHNVQEWSHFAKTSNPSMSMFSFSVFTLRHVKIKLSTVFSLLNCSRLLTKLETKIMVQLLDRFGEASVEPEFWPWEVSHVILWKQNDYIVTQTPIRDEKQPLVSVPYTLSFALEIHELAKPSAWSLTVFCWAAQTPFTSQGHHENNSHHCLSLCLRHRLLVCSGGSCCW